MIVYTNIHVFVIVVYYAVVVLVVVEVVVVAVAVIVEVVVMELPPCKIYLVTPYPTFSLFQINSVKHFRCNVAKPEELEFQVDHHLHKSIEAATKQFQILVNVWVERLIYWDTIVSLIYEWFMCLFCSRVASSAPALVWFTFIVKHNSCLESIVIQVLDSSLWGGTDPGKDWIT